MSVPHPVQCTSGNPLTGERKHGIVLPASVPMYKAAHGNGLVYDVSA